MVIKSGGTNTENSLYADCGDKEAASQPWLCVRGEGDIGVRPVDEFIEQVEEIPVKIENYFIFLD